MTAETSVSRMCQPGRSSRRQSILPAMGTFEVDLEVGDIYGRRFEPVRALVDTGSSYLRVPASLLRSLGVDPIESQRFRMADGREADYEVGEAQVRLDGRRRFNTVVFGEDDSE